MELFNGEEILFSDKDYEKNYYLIEARDKNENLVAMCRYDIVKIFTRKLSIEERKQLAKYNKISFKKTPEFEKIELRKQELQQCGQDCTRLLKNEKMYNFDHSICELVGIQILRGNFYKVGLGTALLKRLEQISNKNNCTEIYAYYKPFGRFKAGAKNFYLRNGFKFNYVEAAHACYATKILPKINEIDFSLK